MDMKYQPFGSHAIEIKMRSLMFKSPPSTAKYDTTSLNEIEMTSTAMPRPKKNSFVKYKFETKFNIQKLLPTVFGSSSLT